jgi:hypothetical protein
MVEVPEWLLYLVGGGLIILTWSVVLALVYRWAWRRGVLWGAEAMREYMINEVRFHGESHTERPTGKVGPD